MKNCESTLWAKVGISSLLIVLLVVTALAAKPRPQRATSANLTPERLAILTTPNNGPDTYLHLAEVGRPFPAPTALLHHLPDAAVKGVALPDGSVLVVADYEPGRDRSFRSGLFRMTPGEDSVLLCDHVDFASKPFVTPDSQVFVQRGNQIPTASEGQHQTSNLSIDQVDPHTGAIKTIWRGTGYVAFIAGIFHDDILVYNVLPSGARIIQINRVTGAEKNILPSLPPYASDFYVTASGNLIFQNLDDAQNSTWSIKRLDLISGNLGTIQKGSSNLSPRVWPSGDIMWTSLTGLERNGSKLSAAPAGMIDIRAFNSAGTMAAAYFFSKNSSSPEIILLDSDGGQISKLSIPQHTPLTIAGFLP